MEQDIYFLVGQNIKKQRKLKKLTQLQLANKSYFSYEFIRKIESKSSCRNTFSLDTVDKIAKALDIDIRLLFENNPANNVGGEMDIEQLDMTLFILNEFEENR